MEMATGHWGTGPRQLLVAWIGLLTCASAGPLAAQATFARTGDLTVARNLASATLLTDGRVLVTGGTRAGASGPVFNQSAEIYDPSTGAFTATGPMSEPRFGAAAARLNDGRVLVLGGQSNLETLPGLPPLFFGSYGGSITISADRFDPAVGAFKATGTLLHPRQLATATLLKDGRVLVVGGQSLSPNLSVVVLSSSEIYDPKTGAFTASGDMSTRRSYHAAVALSDGSVLVLGGYNPTGSPLFPQQVERFDPASGSFATIGQLNTGRQGPSVTLLPDGKVLVAGGTVPTSDGNALVSSNTVEVFDPSTGKCTTVGTMSEGRVNHTAVALADGRVLLAGGSTGGTEVATGLLHSTASADLFDPKTGILTPVAPFTEARSQSAAVRLLDGRVLIAGGARVTNQAVSAWLQTAELYAP